MSTLTEAHKQWASRPAEERFTTLTEMHSKMLADRAISKAKVLSSRDLSAVPTDDNQGPDRNFVVVFTAHGPSKKLVGDEQQGGCYGTSGFVRLAWENTKQAPAGDAVRLKAWAQALPPGSLIRHHIVGDLGRAQA